MFNGNNLGVVNNMRYLGLVISQGGSFQPAMKVLSSQARKAVFALLKRTNQFINLSPVFLNDLFSKTVLPILCYACEVWGFTNIDYLEKVHLWYCKMILKVKTTTLSEMVYCELGIFPLYVTHHVRIIKYWLQIVKSDQNRHKKKMYNEMRSEVQRYENVKNWASNVKNLLFENGFVMFGKLKGWQM